MNCEELFSQIENELKEKLMNYPIESIYSNEEYDEENYSGEFSIHPIHLIYKGSLSDEENDD